MLLYSLYKRKFSLMGNFSSSYFQVFCVLIFNVCFLWTAYCSYSTCNLQSDSICLSGAICTQFKLIAISNICVFNSFILLYFSTFSIGFMFSISPFLTSLLAVNIFILLPSFNLTNDLFLTFHGYSNKLPFISIQQGNYICSLSHHFFYCPVFWSFRCSNSYKKFLLTFSVELYFFLNFHLTIWGNFPSNWISMSLR